MNPKISFIIPAKAQGFFGERSAVARSSEPGQSKVVMPGLDLNKSGHDGSSGEKKTLVPGLETPLDPFRAGSGMSDDDVGLDRERQATLVSIGRQPAFISASSAVRALSPASPTALPSGEPVR